MGAMKTIKEQFTNILKILEKDFEDYAREVLGYQDGQTLGPQELEEYLLHLVDLREKRKTEVREDEN